MSELEHPVVKAANALEEADVLVAETLVPHARQRLVRAIGTISDLTDQEPFYAAAAGVIATGVVLRNGHTFRAGTRILATHLLATAVRGMIKHLVDRTRPIAAAETGEYRLGKAEHYESDFNSFPSGHTAGAVAVAAAVGRAWPSTTTTAAGLASLAALAQVLRSKHYLTDVLAGAAVGLAAHVAIDRLIRAAEQR
jgi:membrane-associated phospholipid phosphatase